MTVKALGHGSEPHRKSSRDVPAGLSEDDRCGDGFECPMEVPEPESQDEVEMVLKEYLMFNIFWTSEINDEL
jgi:hypothetical protein